jgi:hypothetical protein
MITYQIPLVTYPDTYNKGLLMYAAPASQRNRMAVYLSSIYAFEATAATSGKQYRATGTRYDMGKSCVRFRRIDDLPLDLIGRTIAAHSGGRVHRQVRTGTGNPPSRVVGGPDSGFSCVFHPLLRWRPYRYLPRNEFLEVGMRKSITGLAVVALVAGVALVAISLSQAPSAFAEETEGQVFNRPLEDVLNGLVDDGVITEDQRDRIGAALEERFVRFGKGFRGTPYLQTVAEVLEMDVDDLATQLRDGSTIAEIAGNKTADVIAALVAGREARIDEAVADGRLTEEKAEEVRNALVDQVEAVVNGEHSIGMLPFGMDRFHRPGGLGGFGFRGEFHLGTIAGALGMDIDVLRDQLAAGSSIADIAQEKGVDTQVIVTAVSADLDEHLNELVADDRLTQERADEIRAGLTATIESMINGDMPAFGGFRFDRGESLRHFCGHGRGTPGPGGFFNVPDDVEGADTSA